MALILLELILLDGGGYPELFRTTREMAPAKATVGGLDLRRFHIAPTRGLNRRNGQGGTSELPQFCLPVWYARSAGRTASDAYAEAGNR